MSSRISTCRLAQCAGVVTFVIETAERIDYDNPVCEGGRVIPVGNQDVASFVDQSICW
jgi:hypothetical protein